MCYLSVKAAEHERLEYTQQAEHDSNSTYHGAESFHPPHQYVIAPLAVNIHGFHLTLIGLTLLAVNATRLRHYAHDRVFIKRVVVEAISIVLVADHAAALILFFFSKEIKLYFIPQKVRKYKNRHFPYIYLNPID